LGQPLLLCIIFIVVWVRLVLILLVLALAAAIVLIALVSVRSAHAGSSPSNPERANSSMFAPFGSSSMVVMVRGRRVGLARHDVRLDVVNAASLAVGSRGVRGGHRRRRRRSKREVWREHFDRWGLEGCRRDGDDFGDSRSGRGSVWRKVGGCDGWERRGWVLGNGRMIGKGEARGRLEMMRLLRVGGGGVLLLLAFAFFLLSSFSTFLDPGHTWCMWKEVSECFKSFMESKPKKQDSPLPSSSSSFFFPTVPNPPLAPHSLKVSPLSASSSAFLIASRLFAP
jgi:hypothetical protein